MKAMLKLFDTWWLQTLGYTLLHSLWQALIIAAVVILIVRLIPNKLSAVRYLVASFALLTIASLSIATFVYLCEKSPASINPKSVFPASYTLLLLPEVSTSVTTYLASAGGFIQYSLPLFLMVWIFGTSLFSVRILAGLIYVEKLRQKSSLLQIEWTDYIQKLTKQLNINRFVSLAESNLIQVPVVIGHLKPMILIPVGMCTSLSTEQLETIFLHEMTHIRRKDYLINLLQVAAEAVYFFNPFVWIISGIMKREREHCCDDAVVQLHGSAKEYAKALATLEELRLSKVGMSLSLAENKNQLSNRIKRLMERSVKNYSSRERIVPVLLLVIGLICASWISTQSSKTELMTSNPKQIVLAGDTNKKDKKVKPPKKVESKISKAEPQKLKEKATPDPELEQLEELDFEYSMKFNQGAFPIPDFEFTMPPVPPVIELDLSDGFVRNGENWDEFTREFEQNFKEKFGDFYEKHGEDIDRMLNDVHAKINTEFDKDWGVKLQEFADKQAALVEKSAEHWRQQSKLLSEAQHSLNEQMEMMEGNNSFQHESFEQKMKAFEKGMKAFEEKNQKYKVFEEKMREQLIQDGYLGKDEKLESIYWYNDEIEVNGKKIKPEDAAKYKEIQDKYLDGC